MNDRELLEWAARAVGAKAWALKVWPGICLSDDPDCFPFEVYANGRHKKGWNPLQDDGDALRLAVKLGIEVHPDREIQEIVTAFCVRTPKLVGLNTMEEFNGDEMAATRRAIVRAAAEIGKAMQ